MSRFNKQTRQRIIDEYLAATGENAFVPSHFIDWLSGQPEHEAYPAFFSIEDVEAARAYRIDMARRFVSGLRITVSESTVTGKDRKVSVRMIEAPRYISPVAGRRDGGGYQPYDSTNPEAVSELRRQSATALHVWYRRYESVLTNDERSLASDLQKLLEEMTASA